MSDWPRISIVTPSFNQGKFIEETICSVLDQKYPNLEYIVMDGGSTDGTVPILKKYSAKLTHWESEKDRGQSHAINKGFARSTGERMNWLNSDDTLLPGALEKIAAQHCKTPGELISGGYVSVWGKRRVNHPFSSGLDARTLAFHWQNKVRWHQASIFFTREMWQRCGPLNEKLHFAMDYEFYLKLAQEFPCAYVDGEISTYRFHGASKAMNQTQAWGNEWCDVAEANWPPGIERPDFAAARKQRLAKHCSEAGMRALMRGEFRTGKKLIGEAFSFSTARTLRMIAAPQRLLRFWWESRL